MKSLNEIAFENVYHLLLHYVSAVSTYVGRAKTVKTVRELLDEYLIGPKYSPMREKMIAKYSQNHNFQWEELYLVLDCVLDESSVKFAEYFTSHFHAPPPHHAVSLINTVVKRCPLLQELSLTIAHYRPILTLQHESLIAKSFSQLGNLTKLELNWSRQSSLPSSDYIQFYSLIGNSCPKLVQLKLGQHFPFGNDQALALVLGEKVHLLPESMKQQIRQTVLRVKIDDKYITPMCKSLQHLEAHFTQSTASSDAICLLTFVLHHLPKLEILDLNSCMDYYEDFDHFVALAVSNLHKPSDCTSRPPQTTVIPSECLGWTVNAPPPSNNLLILNLITILVTFRLIILNTFAESLNLRMLDSSVRQYVDVCSSNQLNAVASLCPRLKTVSFKDRYIERGDIELSPQQVASLFDNQFQQVIIYITVVPLPYKLINVY